jgi:hypothetical protein
MPFSVVIFEILGNFEIKNSTKKLECISRFFVKTEFKNLK